MDIIARINFGPDWDVFLFEDVPQKINEELQRSRQMEMQTGFFQDLDGNGKVEWHEKVQTVLKKAFSFFSHTALPLVNVAVPIAAAFTKDPKAVAALNITEAATPILSDILAQLESGADSIVVNRDQAQNLAQKIVDHGATVNAK